MAEINEDRIAQVANEYVEIMNQEFFEYVDWYSQGFIIVTEQQKSDIKEQFRKYLTTFASKL
jgi:hypothetical protein